MKILFKKAKQTRLLSVFCLTSLLLACASGPKKAPIPLVTDKAAKVELLASETYLPFLKVDQETAARLAYKGKANPYLKERGQLEKNVIAEYIKAKRAFNQKQFKSAQSSLTAIVKMNPKLGGPYVLLGDIKLQQKDKDGALAQYAEAIKVNPDNINAYLKLAKLQREMGLFKHAQNTYVKALALWPDFPEAHLNLSILYDTYLNKPQVAQKHLEAYLLLAKQPIAKAGFWLKDLNERTGQSNYIDADARAKQAPILARLAAEKAALEAQERAEREAEEH